MSPEEIKRRAEAIKTAEELKRGTHPQSLRVIIKKSGYCVPLITTHRGGNLDPWQRASCEIFTRLENSIIKAMQRAHDNMMELATEGTDESD